MPLIEKVETFCNIVLQTPQTGVAEIIYGIQQNPDNFYDSFTRPKKDKLGHKIPGMSTEYDIFGQGAQPLPDLPAPELVPEDEADDDFDTPYKPVEYIKLPFKEADFPVIMRQHIAMSPLNRKVPIFISDIAPLGAIASRIRLNYPYDLQPHAILIQTIIEAPPSTATKSR